MRIGIIICDRYRSCDGGKCFRSVRNREGAFKRYEKDEPLEVVAYSTCGGCPGGNVENLVMGMKKNGAQIIHFATGVLAGYPACKYLDELRKYTEEKTGLPVIIGTHPMPLNYITMHEKLGDWSNAHFKLLEEFQLVDHEETVKYDSSLPDFLEKLQQELNE
ncbi:MAG: CGGC domain-containing protein [Candidatus Hodarchaeales archaeon]